MSIPALMAILTASFLVAAMWSRVHRLLISAQSVTIIPSQFKSSFNHSVSSSRLAWKGIPLSTPEFTITDSAPALTAAKNGAKCFSRISLREIEEGVRSLPETGTPYPM